MTLFDMRDYETPSRREAVSHVRITTEGTVHDYVDALWFERAIDEGLNAREFAQWRTISLKGEVFIDRLDGHTTTLATANYRDGGKAEALVRVGEALVTISYSAPGHLWVGAAAETQEEASGAVDFLARVFPKEQPKDDAPPAVEFALWANEQPFPHRHTTDVTPWDALCRNYPKSTRERLAALLDPSFEPGRGGRLLLLFGPPGTGKSTFLCTAAWEWRRRVELTVVSDPVALLSDMSYFTRVALMRRSDERWGLVVLEDSGSLFSPMADLQAGENRLGALLNATSGILGGASRSLIACTTNLPLDSLHAAVSRPGRCLAAIEFEPFPEDEAREWLLAKERPDLAAEVRGARTLAELYALVNGSDVGPTRRRRVGFRGVS